MYSDSIKSFIVISRKLIEGCLVGIVRKEDYGMFKMQLPSDEIVKVYMFQKRIVEKL